MKSDLSGTKEVLKKPGPRMQTSLRFQPGYEHSAVQIDLKRKTPEALGSRMFFREVVCPVMFGMVGAPLYSLNFVPDAISSAKFIVHFIAL